MSEKKHISFKVISEELDNLYQKVNTDDLNSIDDLSKVLELFITGEKISDFTGKLEFIYKELNNQKDSKKEVLYKLKALISSINSKNYEYLLEKIKRDSKRLSINKEIASSINKEMFRILEQTRLGKKDIVIGMFIRIFTAKKEQFPKSLIDATKYEDNIFKSYIYAFLSNFCDKGSN